MYRALTSKWYNWLEISLDAIVLAVCHIFSVLFSCRDMFAMPFGDIFVIIGVAVVMVFGFYLLCAMVSTCKITPFPYRWLIMQIL